jgi:tetratricopeptide (TPR) repeat protein
MSIESLKEQARRHEQKEEWRKALDHYKKAIVRLEKDDQPDIGLYNRVGDLYVRVSDLVGAAEHYERAVDLYVEAGLHNNAIAVCKKIVRNIPFRHEVYLKMGQIRAGQGFLSDARSSFLTYAERMQQGGDLDESFRALIEFCDLAADDVELRIAVAEQLATHDRSSDAARQLLLAFHRLDREDGDGRREEVRARILELDPEADFTAPATVEDASLEHGAAYAGDVPDEDASSVMAAGTLDGFETTALATDTAEQERTFEDVPEGEGSDMGRGQESAPPEATAAEALPERRDDRGADPAEDADESGQTVGGAGVAATLDQDEEDVEDEPLPLIAYHEEEDEETAEIVEAVASDSTPESPDAEGEADLVAGIEMWPDDVGLRQRALELAYQEGEPAQIVSALLGLAGALERTGEEARAGATYRHVLELDPVNEVALAALGTREPKGGPRLQEVAANDDYVDLGSMLLGEPEEKTTRFVVAYEEPSGDEDADFARMLSRFKEKVSESLGADDVKSHHDLGTAYKEMGLLDEAVAEFQQALRGSAGHLPTYESLGQTFMEMGNPSAALRTLERALDVDYEVEDELLGIYYHLGRAYQEVGNTESALEFYDRVFALDINFADVTERLRSLR